MADMLCILPWNVLLEMFLRSAIQHITLAAGAGVRYWLTSSLVKWEWVASTCENEILSNSWMYSDVMFTTLKPPQIDCMVCSPLRNHLQRLPLLSYSAEHPFCLSKRMGWRGDMQQKRGAIFPFLEFGVCHGKIQLFRCAQTHGATPLYRYIDSDMSSWA